MLSFPGASEAPLCLQNLVDGRSFFFESRADAVAALWAMKVGRLRGETVTPYLDFFATDFSEWRLTNVYGESLGWADLPARKKYSWGPSHWEVGERRRSVVPGTGNRRAYGNWLRYPKTLNLLREAVACDDEPGEVHIPPTRKKKRAIPTAYDDIYRRTQRSWKQHRGRQWK